MVTERAWKKKFPIFVTHSEQIAILFHTIAVIFIQKKHSAINGRSQSFEGLPFTQKFHLF